MWTHVLPLPLAQSLQLRIREAMLAHARHGIVASALALLPPALSDRLGCPAIPALCHALAQFAHPRRTLRRQYRSRPVSTQAHSCTMTVHALALSARPVWGTSAVLSVLVMTTRAGSSAPPLRSVSVTTHALSFLWVTVTVLCVLATDTASARVSYHP